MLGNLGCISLLMPFGLHYPKQLFTCRRLSLVLQVEHMRNFELLTIFLVNVGIHTLFCIKLAIQCYALFPDPGPDFVTLRQLSRPEI